MKRVIVMPSEYRGHKQKNLAVFIHKVKNVIKYALAVYPIENHYMMFVMHVASLSDAF